MTPPTPPETGLFDVHSHLLPGLDDGCSDVAESIACARRLVELGYTDSFCTPHYWPSLPDITPTAIPARIAELQRALDAAAVPVRLHAGSEINLRPDLLRTPLAQLPSYAMAGRHYLADLWAAELPTWLPDVVRHLQSAGGTVILAHPERMEALQDDPPAVESLLALGVLLQGNAYCLVEPPDSPNRITADRYLRESRYHLLGSDLHHLDSLPRREAGLARARELLPPDTFRALLIDQPRQLLP